MTKQREDGRDEWVTPSDVFLKICEHWNVFPQIDVAASEENKKCQYYFDECSDALEIDWVEAASVLCVEPIFWMNPPYSQPLMTKFIEHAIKMTNKGATVLFLLPAFPDQNWYHDLIKQFPHEFWRGRIKFQPPAGIKPSSPRNGNIHGIILPLKNCADCGRAVHERMKVCQCGRLLHRMFGEDFAAKIFDPADVKKHFAPEKLDWSDCL